MIVFLFLAHLAVGVIFTLLLVSREAGVKFFRFNAGLAATLLLASLAFQPAGPASLPGGSAVAVPSSSIAALWLTTAAIAAYWLTIGRAWRRAQPLLLGTAAAGGLATILIQAIALSAPDTLARALTAASFLTSAALLGGACTSMILGHWYLVLPSMDVSHLKSIVRFHIGSLLMRIGAVGAVILVFAAASEPIAGVDLGRYIFSVGGIFFWQRVLFGLAGPAFLAYLTWETAKIRSTQSATGILYVDFFTVIVGEVLAKYLLFATSAPL